MLDATRALYILDKLEAMRPTLSNDPTVVAQFEQTLAECHEALRLDAEARGLPGKM